MFPKSQIKQAAYYCISIILIVFVILLFWVILWKFALEPNPLVRDFFDLDVKKKVKKSAWCAPTKQSTNNSNQNSEISAHSICLAKVLECKLCSFICCLSTVLIGLGFDEATAADGYSKLTFYSCLSTLLKHCWLICGSYVEFDIFVSKAVYILILQ